MSARRHLTRDRMRLVYVKRCGILHTLRGRIAMYQHETRHPVGQRRLADAGRAADQPGMGNAPAFISLEQCALGLAMAEQHVGFARAPDLDVVAHGAVVSAVRRCSSGCRRCSTALQMRSATTARGARPSMTTQRFGSLAASAR